MKKSNEEPWAATFTDLLRDYFREAQARNSRYSLRAFANKVGMSPGSLSEVLSGKASWRVTSDRAAEILDRLDLEPQRRDRMLVKMNRTPKREIKALKSAGLSMLTDWTFGAIMMAHELPAEKKSPEALARRFGISRQKVVSTIRELKAHGLIGENPKNPGELILCDTVIQMEDEIPTVTLRKHHETSLQTAMKALSHIPVEGRDFTSVTFTGTRAQLAEVKKEIRALHRRVLALTGGSTVEEVFQMNVQVLPLNFEEGYS